MKEQRTVKVGPGVDLRATIEDGELKYMEVIAKKTQLKKDEVSALRDWLNTILNDIGNVGLGNIPHQTLNDKIDADLYDGGAIPLEERSASNPPEINLAAQVVDMSDKLVDKPVVKFTVGGK